MTKTASAILFQNEENLEKVTYEESTFHYVNENYSYKQFIFPLIPGSHFRFRIICKVHVFQEQKRVDLNLLGQEHVLRWESMNNDALYQTDRICPWVVDDVNTIVEHLIQQIQREFPTFVFDERTRRDFYNRQAKKRAVHS